MRYHESVRLRTATSWLMGYGPAVLWVGLATARLHSRLGYGRALAFGLFTGLGVLGFTSLFVAYFPSTVERLGLERFGAWLRRWWDEDAR